MVTKIAVYAITMSLLFLNGCGLDAGPESSPRVTLESDQRPIFNGAPDTAPEHMAVVALTYGPGTSYFCSGTLISRKVVLSAAHCLQGVNATSVEVFFGQDLNGSGEFRAVADALRHPDYNNGQLRNDLAMLRLATNAPSAVTPIPHLPGADGLGPADLGVDVDHAGFGLTENGTDEVKLHVAMPIGLICDGPTACTYLGASVNAKSFAYSMAPGGPCSGDSGGPAFILRAFSEYVAGVTSYGDGPCLDYGVSTAVHHYQPWIDGFIAAVPEEDCLAAGDEDGDGDANCADADCTAEPVCQGLEDCTTARTTTGTVTPIALTQTARRTRLASRVSMAECRTVARPRTAARPRMERHRQWTVI